MDHKKIICKKCGKVILQCRCMDCNKTTEYSICDDCKNTSNEPSEVRHIEKFEISKEDLISKAMVARRRTYPEHDINVLYVMGFEDAIEACHQHYTEQINRILNDLFHTSSYKLSDKIRLLAGNIDKAGEGFKVGQEVCYFSKNKLIFGKLEEIRIKTAQTFYLVKVKNDNIYFKTKIYRTEQEALKAVEECERCGMIRTLRNDKC